MKIPSPELEKQLQKLYEVPKSDQDDGNNGNGNGATNSNDESSKPQYITQGDLIKEVISNYAKTHVKSGETTNPPRTTNIARESS